jgi:hypothetical protein
MIVAVLWLLASVIAALPLCVETVDYFGEEFYGGNGVCLPLHIQDPFADVSEQKMREFENSVLGIGTTGIGEIVLRGVS